MQEAVQQQAVLQPAHDQAQLGGTLTENNVYSYEYTLQ